MRELRLVAVSEDGARIVLVSDNGEQFGLPLDERLRAAIRRDRARLGQLEIQLESQLRPREIQARIRAGETAEQVAQAAGVPVERVRWFEGPVLQEREHMAASARGTAVRRQGDGPVPLLGELVEGRLAERGVDADSLQWDSCRRDDGRWEIRVSFTAKGHARDARWVFDPTRRVVSADDDEARWLSGEQAAPKPARERGARTSRRPRPDGPFVPRLAGGRDASVEPERPAEQPTGKRSPTEPEAPGEPAEEPGEEPTGTAAARAEQPQPAAPADAEAEQPAGAEQPAAAARPKSGRRASVPSWDDIVFGTGRGN